jgi:hypothetical protein
MHIIRFEAQNIQRLSAVSISPTDSPAVVLAGGNEEGKSSCLDAIEMALGGEKTIPPEPIRRGQDKAHVLVDLGDMIVTRRFTKGGSSITVTNREGLKYPSPQSLLDGLYNRLTFDPLEFARLSETKDGRARQAEILRTLAGVDTSALEKERGMVFSTRTDVNRDLARERAVLERAPQYDDVGAELQDAKTIVAQLEDADRLAKVLGEAERQVALAQTGHKMATDRLTRAKAAVDVARRALEAAEDEQLAAEKSVDAADTVQKSRIAEQVAAAKAVPDVAGLRTQLAGVQEYNRKVEANTRRAEQAKSVDELQKTADAHTQRLDAIDKEKADRLAAAKFPVEGLGLSDTGVTWKELPFEQASTAIRTRVSVAIGFALHPKLKVLLVRNGNDLDEKNLQLLGDAAKEAGGQLWIERIAGGGDGLQTVVIEDGAVQGAERQRQADEPASKVKQPDEVPVKAQDHGADAQPPAPPTSNSQLPTPPPVEVEQQSPARRARAPKAPADAPGLFNRDGAKK